MKEGSNSLLDREEHRKELYWAIRTRVLTDAEMGEVASMGMDLVIEMYPLNSTTATSGTYRVLDKVQEFNAALLQQFKIRHMASIAKIEDVS